MADLHRLPHRFGDTGPGRIDQIAGRRAGDEDAREVEQQGRVLVAARVEPGQRHQQFAALQVGVAEQVEGGVGRDETVAGERAQQVRGAGPDHLVDLGDGPGGCAAPARGRLRMALGDGVEQGRDRPADRLPVGIGVVAGAPQRLAEIAEAVAVVQFGQPGAPQQRAQRRVAERGAVEFGKMRVAAARRQQRIADIVQRRPVLAGRQRANGGPGKKLKAHDFLEWSLELSVGQSLAPRGRASAARWRGAAVHPHRRRSSKGYTKT